MEPESSKVPVGRAYLLYCCLLLAAMLMAAPSPKMIVIAYMFPFGISMLFRTPAEGTGTVLPVIAYLAYGVFFFLFGAFRQRRGFYWLCIAFIIFLLLNVAGCRKMLGALEHVT
jgi:hypothetical protein